MLLLQLLFLFIGQTVSQALVGFRLLPNSGFHRHIEYSFNLADTTCQTLVISQGLSSSWIVDRYEISQLIGFSAEGPNQLEAPSWLASNTTLVIKLNIHHNPSTLVVSAPVHLRYHSLNETGFQEARIEPPEAFLVCEHKEVRVDTSQKALVTLVPVGRPSDTELVSKVTTGVVLIGSVILLEILRRYR